MHCSTPKRPFPTAKTHISVRSLTREIFSGESAVFKNKNISMQYYACLKAVNQELDLISSAPGSSTKSMKMSSEVIEKGRKGNDAEQTERSLLVCQKTMKKVYLLT